MAKRSQKASRKVTENKEKAEPTSNPTAYRQSRKRLMAKVTSIQTNGFYLRVSGTDYFLSFDNFPWFRYASDIDIRRMELAYGNPDDDGEFCIRWPLLDVFLGTNHIKQIIKNPIKRPHPIAHPSQKGKLTNRIKEKSCNEQTYEVEASFTFKGRFTVTAENAEQARQFVRERCRADIGNVVIDVHIPFNEIAWNFSPFRTDAEIGNIFEAD